MPRNERRLIIADPDRKGTIQQHLAQGARRAQEENPIIRSLEQDVFRPIEDVIQEAKDRGVREFQDQQYLQEWVAFGQKHINKFRGIADDVQELYNVTTGKNRKHASEFAQTTKCGRNSFITRTYTSEQGIPRQAVEYRYHLENRKAVLDSYDMMLSRNVTRLNPDSPRIRLNSNQGTPEQILLLYKDTRPSNPSINEQYPVKSDTALHGLLQRWQPYFRNAVESGVLGVGFTLKDGKPPQFIASMGTDFDSPTQNWASYTLGNVGRTFSILGSATTIPTPDFYWNRKCNILFNTISASHLTKDSEDMKQFTAALKHGLGSDKALSSFERAVRIRDIRWEILPKRPAMDTFSLPGETAKQALEEMITLSTYI